MKKLALGAAGMLMLATTVAAYSAFGGWAVVKVSKIPDAWVAGKPLQLSWQVRQHGIRPLGPGDDLHPTLEARSGSRVVHGTAAAYTEEGWKGFRGTIVFPTTGDWQVTINSGFGDARAAQRADDWATYGTEMRRLGEVLRQLGTPPSPAPR